MIGWQVATCATRMVLVGILLVAAGAVVSVVRYRVAVWVESRRSR